MSQNVYNTIDPLEITMINGDHVKFSDIRKPITLVVNVASKCGYTKQYEQLEQLQKDYGGSQFTVIGCPSNQFLQEMGDEESIAQMCSATFGVTFPMTAKMRLNGKKADPLFEALTDFSDDEGKAGKVKWNFEKFLILPDGNVKRYRSAVVPDDDVIIEQIKAAL